MELHRRQLVVQAGALVFVSGGGAELAVLGEDPGHQPL